MQVDPLQVLEVLRNLGGEVPPGCAVAFDLQIGQIVVGPTHPSDLPNKRREDDDNATTE